MQRVHRQPRAAAVVQRRRHQERRRALDLDENMLAVEIDLPPLSFPEAVQRCAKLAAQWKRVRVLGAMPRELVERDTRNEGMIELATSELQHLQIEPVALGVTEERDGKDALNTLFKMRRMPETTADEIGDAMTMLIAVPRVLRLLLAMLKPWHLALLGAPGFEDAPLPEEDDALVSFLQKLQEMMVAREAAMNGSHTDEGDKS